MEPPNHHVSARTDLVEDPVKAAATRERGPSVARRLDGDETEAIIGCVMVRLGSALDSEESQPGERPAVPGGEWLAGL